MRLVSLVSVIPFALFSAACGDDGGGTVLLDAEVPDAEPVPPDMAPFSCSGATPDECPGEVCVNLDTDETNCGTCGEACAGGEYCDSGTCMCPDEPFVPAMPQFVVEPSIPDQGTIRIGVGVFSNGGGHVLAALLDNTTTVINTDYPLDANTLTPPGLVAGYNVNVQTQSYDSGFAATAGNLRFTEICAEGFKGVATDVTFQGVTGGFTNPTIDPDGCTFVVPSITFEYGADCPTK